MKKNKKKSSFLSLIILLVVIFIVFRAPISDFLGSGNKEKTVTVTVKSGASTHDIASLLEENGLVEYPVLFRAASKIFGFDGKYKEGSFYMTENMGYNEIFKKLSGVPDSVGAVKVTIPEGYEFRQIADVLEEYGLIDRKVFYDTAQSYDFGYEFLKDIPTRETRLEGYLFPDTYIFDSTSTEKSILDTMLGRFDEVFKDEYKARAKELNMSLDEVITLASIVEREAKGDADRDKVASVFHNRLKSREYPYLESCATVQYILKERKPVLSTQDTEIKSSYNTYINPGLPIGPIASPGESSIKATLYPAETDYLFFVLDSSGTHRFARTYDEHLQNANR